MLSISSLSCCISIVSIGLGYPTTLLYRIDFILLISSYVNSYFFFFLVSSSSLYYYSYIISNIYLLKSCKPSTAFLNASPCSQFFFSSISLTYLNFDSNISLILLFIFYKISLNKQQKSSNQNGLTIWANLLHIKPTLQTILMKAMIHITRQLPYQIVCLELCQANTTLLLLHLMVEEVRLYYLLHYLLISILLLQEAQVSSVEKIPRFVVDVDEDFDQEHQYICQIECKETSVVLRAAHIDLKKEKKQTERSHQQLEQVKIFKRLVSQKQRYFIQVQNVQPFDHADLVHFFVFCYLLEQPSLSSKLFLHPSMICQKQNQRQQNYSNKQKMVIYASDEESNQKMQ